VTPLLRQTKTILNVVKRRYVYMIKIDINCQSAE
jgi:hypothetical protein